MQLDRAIYAAQNNAKAARSWARDLERRVHQWQAAELRAVAVERRAAAVTHLAGGYGVLCAGSYMGAQRKARRTKEVAEVTCPKCLARHAQMAARRAAMA